MSEEPEICPQCGQRGRPVKAITLESQLTETAKRRLTSGSGFRFCASGTCETAYYQPEEGQTFSKNDVRSPIFQKETKADRLICYCFKQSLAAVQDNGAAIARDIGEKCKEGLDRCEELNPQGRCCLGNIRQVTKVSGGVQPAADCCQPTPERVKAPSGAVARANLGKWATGGAIAAAVFSSACCWLPLMLIGLGLSTVGFATFFEAYRMYLLLGAGGLLAVGFYLNYGRQPACGPDGSCSVPSRRVQRWSRLGLWVAAVTVVGFGLFPNYVGLLLGSGEPTQAVAAEEAKGKTYVFRVDGMTCEPCAVGLQKKLQSVKGVTRAIVSYNEKRARVVVGVGGPNAETLKKAIAKAGYKGTEAT